MILKNNFRTSWTGAHTHYLIKSKMFCGIPLRRNWTPMISGANHMRTKTHRWIHCRGRDFGYLRMVCVPECRIAHRSEGNSKANTGI